MPEPWFVIEKDTVSVTLKFTGEQWHNINEEAQRRGVTAYALLHDPILIICEAQRSYNKAGGAKPKKGR